MWGQCINKLQKRSSQLIFSIPEHCMLATGKLMLCHGMLRDLR
jgi:hypothetical protein